MIFSEGLRYAWRDGIGGGLRGGRVIFMNAGGGLEVSALVGVWDEFYEEGFLACFEGVEAFAICNF